MTRRGTLRGLEEAGEKSVALLIAALPDDDWRRRAVLVAAGLVGAEPGCADPGGRGEVRS